MKIEFVNKVLELFFAFHDVEGEDSIYIEENIYNDDFFRWTKSSFKHGKKLTVIYNNESIRMFDTQKVRERLASNVDKIRNNPSKTLFGLEYVIVKDLIMNLNVEPLTQEDIDEMKKFKEEAENDRIRKEKIFRESHCTCENPITRTKQIGESEGFKILRYCIKCNKNI